MKGPPKPTRRSGREHHQRYCCRKPKRDSPYSVKRRVVNVNRHFKCIAELWWETFERTGERNRFSSLPVQCCVTAGLNQPHRSDPAASIQHQRKLRNNFARQDRLDPTARHDPLVLGVDLTAYIRNILALRRPQSDSARFAGIVARLPGFAPRPRPIVRTRGNWGLPCWRNRQRRRRLALEC